MDTPNENSNAQGGTSQPLAGSQPIAGNLRCPKCGTRLEYSYLDRWDCPRCEVGMLGSEAAPAIAPRPGTSALGPPAPDSLAGEHREPALRAGSAATPKREDFATAARVLRWWLNCPQKSEATPERSARLSVARASARAMAIAFEAEAEPGPNTQSDSQT